MREMVDATLSPSARPFFPGSDQKVKPNQSDANVKDAPGSFVAAEKVEKIPDQLDVKILEMKA